MRLGLRVALLLVAAVVVACSDDPSSVALTSTATSVPPIEPTTVATVVAERTLEPDATVSPPERRIGIEALDELASAILAADVAYVEGKLEYFEAPCKVTSDPIPGPVCPTGVAVGTPIDVFALSGCHSSFEPAVSIGPVVDGFAVPGLALLAAYRVEPPPGDPLGPVGDYVLVFVRTNSQLIAVAANADGGIVRWTGSCGVTDPAAFLAELPIGEYVLAPVE
ncbi:MAG: hypothetical protein HOH95_09705 [Dehalococcoidia bacterium]|nr:hypothetical protein [Dehalococcoidia bacterium]